MKAAAVCAAASVLAVLLRRDNPAAALLLGIAASCAALVPALTLIGSAAAFFDDLADAAGIPPAALGAVLRTMGIAILTRFASDLCRDAGVGSAASAVELAGSAAALFVAVPLIRTILQMIEGLL